MRIPYVIDNLNNQLASVLNYLLQRQQGQDVDIATAYFSIRGYQLLRQTLPSVNCFRLMLGDDPHSGDDIGLRPDAKGFLRRELNAEPLREESGSCVVKMSRCACITDVHRGRRVEGVFYTPSAIYFTGV
jgi:hypothetical protein